MLVKTMSGYRYISNCYISKNAYFITIYQFNLFFKMLYFIQIYLIDTQYIIALFLHDIILILSNCIE